MSIPNYLLPHRVTVQTASAVTDEYGDTVESWAAPTETTVNARIEFRPVGQSENTKDRQATLSHWQILLNDEITETARIVWDGHTFLVDGEVAPVYAASSLSHYEGLLKLAD